MTPRRQERGSLRQVRPRGPVLRFQINPPQMVPAGGVGGWATIARPRRREAVEWIGTPAKRFTFLLVFDGWAKHDNPRHDVVVEPECRMLQSFGEPRAPMKPPPVLKLNFGPHGRGRLWVIESIEHGEAMLNDKLQRIRAEFTVTLVEYIDPGVTFKSHTKRGKGKGGKGGKGNRIVEASARDTLATIAARELGDTSRWREIATLNGLRDPNFLTPGQRITLPDE